MSIIPASQQGMAGNRQEAADKTTLIAELRQTIEEQRQAIEDSNRKIAELEDELTRKNETIRNLLGQQDEARAEAKRPAKKGRKEERQ